MESHPDTGEFQWPAVPWAAKGKGILFTMEDSCAMRPLVDLWKESSKIDAEIRRTYMVFWKDWLNDDGEIPSGKTLEDGAVCVLETHWKESEKKRIQRLRARIEKKDKGAAILQLAEGLPPPTVMAQAVDATAADAPVVQATTGPTRSPLRQLGVAALSALSSLASAASSSLNVVDAEEEEEEECM